MTNSWMFESLFGNSRALPGVSASFKIDTILPISSDLEQKLYIRLKDQLLGNLDQARRDDNGTLILTNSDERSTALFDKHSIKLFLTRFTSESQALNYINKVLFPYSEILRGDDFEVITMNYSFSLKTNKCHPQLINSVFYSNGGLQNLSDKYPILNNNIQYEILLNEKKTAKIHIVGNHHPHQIIKGNFNEQELLFDITVNKKNDFKHPLTEQATDLFLYSNEFIKHQVVPYLIEPMSDQICEMSHPKKPVEPKKKPGIFKGIFN